MSELSLVSQITPLPRPGLNHGKNSVGDKGTTLTGPWVSALQSHFLHPSLLVTLSPSHAVNAIHSIQVCQEDQKVI